VIHQYPSVGGEPTPSVLSPTPAPKSTAMMPLAFASAMCAPHVTVSPPLLCTFGSAPWFVLK